MATACGPPSPHDGPPGPPPDRPPISHAEVPTTTLPPQLTAGEQQADIVILLLEGQWNDSRDDQTPEDGLVQGLERRPSLRFEAAYSQSSRPFPSTVSMLTGLYPSTVPVCAMPLARPGEEPELPWCASIPEGRHTLPQLLAMYGYRTALVHGRVRGGAKLAALFQHGELVPPHRPQATRKRTALWEASLHWWEARAGSPRLLVVADSVLPESIRRASRNPIAPMSSSPALLPDGVAPDPNDLPFDPAALTAEFHLAMVELGQELRPWLERLLTTQERPCWVVITSPAGIDVTAPHPVRPSLGKNPLIQESTVHVPLLVFHSSDWALEHPVERLVELVDLFPSLSSLGGAPPPAGIQGENLFVLSPAADPMAQAYMEHGDMLYLRRGSHLYGMRAMVHFTSALDPQVTNVLAASGPSGPQLHLYDVVADPLQATDLVQQDPTLAREMYELLLATRRAATAPDVQKLEPEQLWELRMSPQQGYW